jgi:hypothetical protein
MADPEPINIYFAEGNYHLTKRRRSRNESYSDNRLPVLAFRRENGSYLALLANYAMHNVALSYQNRSFSADVAGIAAEHARSSLPGKPITLLTNGASGDLVPPDVSPDPNTMHAFGSKIGDAIVQIVQKGRRHSPQALCSEIEDVVLPLTLLSPQDVLVEFKHEAERYKGKESWSSAITGWKDDTLALLNGDPPLSTTAVLQVIRIGPLIFTAIGAEVFSRLEDELRSIEGPNHYVIGYANGNIGYLPFREMYLEGGYEVETAYKFYGNFMISLGGYEQVRDQAVFLLGAIRSDEPRAQDFSPDYLNTNPYK